MKITRKNKPTDLVVLGNKIIDAHYRLSLIETRLIKYASVQIRENDTALFRNLPVNVRIDDFVSMFPDMDQKSAYAQVKRAIDTLFNREFSWVTMVPFEPGKGVGLTEAVHRSRWISKSTYISGNGVAQIFFTEDVINGLARLDSDYTAYQIKQIVNLQSFYSIRMYELLAAYKGMGGRVFLVDELRGILGIGDKLKDFKDFRLRVLTPAIEEINAQTDLKVELIERKVGRSIAELTFKIKLKEDKKSKPKRKKINRSDAEKMALVGETWPQLLKRIGQDFDVEM